MAKGWPAGVSKVEYKAYKAACEQASMPILGARGFQAALDAGEISRDFFVDLIPKDSIIKVGANATPATNTPKMFNDASGIDDGEDSDSVLIPVPGVPNWGLRASRREWIIWKLNTESNIWYQTSNGFRKIEDAIIHVARELQREKILAHKDLTKLGEINNEITKIFESCIKKSFFEEMQAKIRKLGPNG